MKKVFNLKSDACHRYIKYLLLLTFIFLCCFAKAQDTLKNLKQVNFDKSEVKIREFNKSKLDRYRNDPNYHYGKRVPVRNNLFYKFLDWLLRKLFKPLSNPRTYRITEYIIIGICALIVIYAILKLTKSDWLNVFSNKSKKTENPDFDELTENIHELDFDKLIDLALKEQNFTRAVRLSYLKTLKALSDKQLIDWKLNKTNQDYLYEVNKLAFEPEFRHLTFIFEYICYGNFPIQQHEYNSIAETFKTFEQKIK